MSKGRRKEYTVMLTGDTHKESTVAFILLDYQDRGKQTMREERGFRYKYAQKRFI